MEQIERKNAEFEDFKRFQIQSRNFCKQFCGIYKDRLISLKAKTLRKVKLKWKKEKILQIIDLTKDEYKEISCILIGTLYKHQELKPSFLQEIANELQAVPQPPRLNYCSSKDTLFLEDDVSRVKLVGNVTPEALVTGLVCAVLGHGLQDGSFWVEDFCFPGPELKLVTQPTSSCAKDHGKLVLLISGLDLVNILGSLSLELLSDWITGLIGDEESQTEAASIVQVIIAGNSVRGSPETFTRKGYFENKRRESLFSNEVHRAVYQLDVFVSKITKSCPVILLPGEFDPTCHSIPQHAIHPHILPKTLKQGNLHGVTNPWIGKIGSRIVGGTSGQPIMDVMKVSCTDFTPIQWLEKTLEWSHFSPTAPDTLAEYPFDKSDPLVMQEFPHIYFAGNMDAFQTKLLMGIDRNDKSEEQPIRLICIPKFSTSHTAIIVDLESLDARPISFGTM